MTFKGWRVRVMIVGMLRVAVSVFLGVLVIATCAAGAPGPRACVAVDAQATIVDGKMTSYTPGYAACPGK